MHTKQKASGRNIGIVALAIFINLLLAVSIMLAYPTPQMNPLKFFALLGGAALFLFMGALWFVQTDITTCWERGVLVVGGGFVLTLFWGLLMALLSFVLIGLRLVSPL